MTLRHLSPSFSSGSLRSQFVLRAPCHQHGLPCVSSASTRKSQILPHDLQLAAAVQLDDVAREHAYVDHAAEVPGLLVLAGDEGPPDSVMRIFSGRTAKRLPSRTSMFDVPTKPATNSFAGRS